MKHNGAQGVRTMVAADSGRFARRLPRTVIVVEGHDREGQDDVRWLQDGWGEETG